MLRMLGWVALGTALGFALGGVPARREKALLARENAELRAQLRAGSGPNLLRMLLGDPMGGLDDSSEEGVYARDEGTGPAGERSPGASEEGTDGLPARDSAPGEVTVVGGGARGGSGGTGTDTGAGAAQAGADRGPRTPEARRARRQRAMRSLTQGRFKQFAAAQAARAAATRSTLISSANLSDVQVAQLDTAIESTNRKLQGYGEEMLTNVAAGKEPEPAEALSLARDVTDILHEGQTEVDRIVQESSGEVPREAAQIWNLIDADGLSETAERVLPELPPEGSDAFGSNGLRLPTPPEGFTAPAGLADAGLRAPSGSAP